MKRCEALAARGFAAITTEILERPIFITPKPITSNISRKIRRVSAASAALAFLAHRHRAAIDVGARFAQAGTDLFRQECGNAWHQ